VIGYVPALFKGIHGQHMAQNSFFSTIKDPHSVITPIQSGSTFPEFLEEKASRYRPHISAFADLVKKSKTSAELLEEIRNPNNKVDSDTRMSLLKIFRRCVSPICDTEATKKILKIPTSVFVNNYGHTFKPIKKLKMQFEKLSNEELYSLAVLLGEYDNRGAQGYVLTGLFFTWFEEAFPDLSIEGPRGAGQDIQLSKVFKSFDGDFPCDFIIRKKKSGKVLAVGFARYDSTRGGAQSDDRTGGNNDKVSKAEIFSKKSGESFKVIFLSDGPGLAHKDTWVESCTLDGKWKGNVRVTTLRTAPERITASWLESN
jgi:hypothetical protein